MFRLGRRFAVILAFAALLFLLPFTILLLVTDQQFKAPHSYAHIFYQEEIYVYDNNSSVTIQYDESAQDSRSIQADGLLSPKKFKEVDERMRGRRELLRNECSRTGLDDYKHEAYAWEYIINRQYHLIWCNIFKAASTSWMYNFNLMANYTADFLDETTEVPLAMARRKYGRPTAEMVKEAHNDSISFLIVRHPLERLASAYNDKIVHAWENSHHDKMRQKIVQKYRKQQPITGKPVPKYPVYEEFISYLLDEARAMRPLDMHWTPYTDFCTPCKFDIDVILKFETLDEDQRYLIQLSGIQHIVKPEWKNSGESAKKFQINELYSQLSKAQLDGLHSLYKYDFQLFNYTMDIYYEIMEEDTK